MGIGGIGVSALAEMAKAGGALVSGCDRQESDATRALEAKGIEVSIGHSPGHLAGVDLLVHTSAVPPDHPERLAAGDKQVKRGEFLAWLIQPKTAVGIAGTHGKTTTSWLLSSLLIQAGLDPSVFVGGVCPGLEGGNYRSGSGCFVAELDESDESFLLPRLDLAIATNLESEHLSHYGCYDNVRAAFERYAGAAAENGLFIAGIDNPDLADIWKKSRGRKLGFGFAKDADIRAEDIEADRSGSSFILVAGGKRLGRFALSMPGKHNILNALAALGAALELGVETEVLRAALPLTAGVARRLERLGLWGTTPVYSDYAHHPTEIRAALAGLRQICGGRILAVFQPHLFSRTRDYAEDFGRAFAGASALLVADIYPAREQPLPGVSSELVVEAARKNGSDVSGPLSLAEALAGAQRVAGDFAAVVVVGAGDIDLAARRMFAGREGDDR